MTDIVRAHVVRGDEVLLGLRPDERWSTFGGWCEDGESPEETLHRELREELGVEVVAFDRMPDWTTRSDGQAARIAIFAVTEWQGTPRNLATHEHSKIGWFHRDELAGLSMHDRARAEALAHLGGG